MLLVVISAIAIFTKTQNWRCNKSQELFSDFRFSQWKVFVSTIGVPLKFLQKLKIGGAKKCFYLIVLTIFYEVHKDRLFQWRLFKLKLIDGQPETFFMTDSH